MARSVRLDQQWPRYYDRGFRPSSKVDVWRVDLLRGKPIAAGNLDHGVRAHLSGEVSKLERLGYAVERSGDPTTYRITNLDHRPTAEDFAALRAPRNGTEMDRRNGKRAPDLTALTALLPGIADSLIVTMVGFDRDGEPVLTVTGENGWRYETRILRVDPPRDK